MRRTVTTLGLLLMAAASLSAQEKVVIGAAAPNPNATARPSPLSPAIRVGNILWVSGQLGVAPASDSGAANDIKAQTTRSLERTKRLVDEAGSRMDLAVHCTVFLTDIANFASMNESYRTFFPKDPPTRSTVAVSALASPTALVEIECQFVMPPGAK